jgi:HPt (histidine-containing phosphotransfer) domain-containing protein
MPAKLDQIQQAIAQADLSNLRESAHSLKGSASNLGARQLARLCARLESLQESTLGEANQLLAMLQLEFQRVCDALRTEVRK